MKKAMLFFMTLFFSISANAATLNLTTAGSSGATQEVSLNNNDVVLGHGTVDEPNTNWSSFFDLSTDQNTPVKIVWSFNPEANLSSATVSLFEMGGAVIDQFNLISDYSFTATLMTGIDYGLESTLSQFGSMNFQTLKGFHGEISPMLAQLGMLEGVSRALYIHVQN